jgi:hypothetical protein
MHHCGDPDPPRTDLVHAVGAQRCAGATLDENARLSYGAGMLDPKFIDDLARRLTGAMPASAKTLQADLEKNLRAAMQSVFGRLDLVTREEFDVQTKVLARSRARLEQLEQQVAALEQQLLNKAKVKTRAKTKKPP